MGLGPRGDGRAGPRRRAGPMTTAILFGFLVIGDRARGPPSASAGPPRLWRRPAGLRGDVCGDARARAEDGTRSRMASASQVSKSSPLYLRPSPRRGHCIMGATTMKPRNMKPGQLEEAAEYADNILKTDFSKTKCFDEALRRAVQKKMEWPHPPSGEVLFDAVRKHRERAEAAKEEKPKRRAPPKCRRAPSPSPSPQPKRAAKALTEQDQNTDESAIVAVAPPMPVVAAAQHALRALAGSTQVVRRGAQQIKVKEIGGDWVEYKSQRDAARKITIALCCQTPSKRRRGTGRVCWSAPRRYPHAISACSSSRRAAPRTSASWRSTRRIY
jgi:hypothetical protein